MTTPIIKPITSAINQESINLLDIIDILLTAKWRIVLIAGTGLLIGVLYAFLATPIYQANTLIQVESSQNEAKNAIAEMATMFSVESPASAEMEILRSRLVVGKAVDDLRLTISAVPDYIPIIGKFLAGRSKELSTPGIFGIGHMVSGAESISIQTLEVPHHLLEKKLFIIATQSGYILQDNNNETLVQGKLGQIAEFKSHGNLGKILVTELHAKPGARFIVLKSSRLSAVIKLQQELNIIEKGKQSGIISATLSGSDPQKTAAILNAIGSAYVRQNIDRRAAEAEKSLAFLDQFLPELRHQVQDDEQKYTKFRDTHGTFDLTTESQLTLQASADLQTKLLELQQKRRELLPRFKPAHPAIQTIDKQIDGIQHELNRLANSVGKMPDLEQQLLRLMRNVKVNSEMYVNLLNSAQQLRLVKEGKVGNVRVVDSAATPELPIRPKKLIVIFLGILAGLVSGVMYAVIRNWLTPGIKESEEIESTLGLHVYAAVPHSPIQSELRKKIELKTSGNHVLATTAPQDPAIESLRNLRTALQFALIDAKNKIILISGPTPGIGKSFTSVNFAAVMGMAQTKVLLIDTDMRKGHINQYFGIERMNGLSELISGVTNVEEAIHREVLPNVDLITTGTLPPNPAELLLSGKMHALLNTLSPKYDLILLDSAPVLAVSDSLALSPLVGTIFLIVRANKSVIGDLNESVKRVAQTGAQVKGVILNDILPSANRYGGKYGSYRYVDYGYTN